MTGGFMDDRICTRVVEYRCLPKLGKMAVKQTKGPTTRARLMQEHL